MTGYGHADGMGLGYAEGMSKVLLLRRADDADGRCDIL